MRPNTTKPKIRAGILLYARASPVLALLLRDAFRAANHVLGEERFAVELVGLKEGVLHFDDLAITVGRAKKAYDLLFVAPLAQPEAKGGLEGECRLLRAYYAAGAKIAAPCLGVLLLAESGILRGREATTHWAWLEYAKNRFPEVKWNARNMICRDGGLSTSGGYLGTVDLALDYVARYAGKKVGLETGRMLLAESTREKQSVYATRLTLGEQHSTPFLKLEAWLQANLRRDVTVAEMASVCKMSLRNFQRIFTGHYGISPKGHLQLKRIEKAKQLLSDTNLSQEEILEQIGVSDLSSFRRLFRRELGLTPAEFRRRVR